MADQKPTYKVKKGKFGTVYVKVPRRMTIELETATQDQLKILYELKHPFVIKS